MKMTPFQCPILKSAPQDPMQPGGPLSNPQRIHYLLDCVIYELENHIEVAKFTIKVIIIKSWNLKRCFFCTFVAIVEVIAKHGSMCLQIMSSHIYCPLLRTITINSKGYYYLIA